MLCSHRYYQNRVGIFGRVGYKCSQTVSNQGHICEGLISLPITYLQPSTNFMWPTSIEDRSLPFRGGTASLSTSSNFQHYLVCVCPSQLLCRFNTWALQFYCENPVTYSSGCVDSPSLEAGWAGQLVFLCDSGYSLYVTCIFSSSEGVCLPSGNNVP